MKKLFVIFIALFSSYFLLASVKGTVYDDKGDPLVGANVYWAGTTIGVATDLDGRFELDEVKST